MSDYYFEFSNPTTYVKPTNLQIVADVFKDAMLNIDYVKCYGWYNDLLNASSYSDIFDVFNITFEYNEGKLYPKINNVYTHTGFRDALKAVAPFMENGCIYVKDSYYYYLVWFKDGKIAGSRRKLEYGNPLDEPKTEVKSEIKPVTTTEVKTESKVKKDTKAKSVIKQFPKKSTVKLSDNNNRTDITKPVTTARDDNTYTVQELVKELLRQMDLGNGTREVQVNADFLFKN